MSKTPQQQQQQQQQAEDIDEWEAVELSLQQLNIDTTFKPSVVLPSHMLTNETEDDEINFFNDFPETLVETTSTTTAALNVPYKINDNNNNNNRNIGDAYPQRQAFQSNFDGSFQLQYSSAIGSYAQQQPQLEEPIDDTLLEALQSSKERVNTLRLEKDVYDFACSGRPFLEVPNLANSFRRLLLFKIAKRFCMEHRRADYITDQGDRAVLVTLFRTPATYIPRPLLIDLSQQIAVDSLAAADGGGGMSQSQRPVGTAPPKMLVMKRSTPAEGEERKQAAARPTLTVEDKERNYEAVRARIFAEDGSPLTPSEGAGAGAGTGSGGEINATEESLESASPIEHSSASSPGPTELKDAAAEVAPSTGVGAEGVPPAGGSRGKSGRSGQQQQRGGGGVGNKRAVLRNKDAEKNDPDFARRSNPRGSGGGYPQMGYQQQYPVQQQMPPAQYPYNMGYPQQTPQFMPPPAGPYGYAPYYPGPPMYPGQQQMYDPNGVAYMPMPMQMPPNSVPYSGNPPNSDTTEYPPLS